MINPRRTALYIAIGAMTFVAGEAAAGCKYIPYPPGTYVCASWIKGSTDCQFNVESDTPADMVISAKCSLTGVNFIDGAEGSHWVSPKTTGAYCASGSPPPGACESASPLRTSSASTGSASKAAAKAKKAKKEKKCKAKHNGKHNGKPVGHDDSCGDINLPNDEVYLSAEVNLQDDCVIDSSGRLDCRLEVPPPAGSTCANGEPALHFTASEMLGIVEVCVNDGYGEVCNKVYDYCTVDPMAPEGTPYDCVGISTDSPYDDDEQGNTCWATGSNFLTYSPEDPLCGQPRICID